MHRVERAVLELAHHMARRRRCVGRRIVELDDGRVEVVLDAADGQHVEHALAAAAHDVDQLLAVAQDHIAAADHEVRAGDVGVDWVRRYSNAVRTDSSLMPASSRLLMTRSSSRSR